MNVDKSPLFFNRNFIKFASRILYFISFATVCIIFLLGIMLFRILNHDFEKSQVQTECPRFIFLSLHKTGGHKSASNALKDMMEKEHGYAVDVYYVDKKNPEDTYYTEDLEWLMSKPLLRKTLHPLISSKVFLYCHNHIIKHYHARNLHKILKKQQYQGIVSFVWCFNIDDVKTSIPKIVIPTDMKDSFTWTDSKEAYYICGTDKLHKQLKKKGVHEDKIRKVRGMPINKKFLTDIKSKHERKIELGLDPLRESALVIFGSAASDEMIDIMKYAANDNRQFVFVCGKNKALYQQMIKMNAKYGNKFIIKGFVKDVYKWMQASEILLGKPGPGIITECIASKLPILVCEDGVMVHEKYNLKLIKRQNLGKVIKNWDDNLMKNVCDVINNKEIKASLKSYSDVDQMHETMQQFQAIFIHHEGKQ